MNTMTMRAYSHRNSLRIFFKSKGWERWIMLLIILNAITLGMQTSPSIMASWGNILEWVDNIILTIFVIELVLRIYAFGLDFWKSPWSWFDFIVIGIALVPSTGNMSILRALRILRVLRLISAIESMRKVVQGLLHALPGMGSIMALMALIFYVFAVMATNLFREVSPDKFGSLGDSTFTLFQIMTLESWAEGVVRPILAHYPHAWIFFITFILLTSFAVLNLFIGIIVDAMQTDTAEETMDLEKAQHQETMAKLEEVMQELQQVKEQVAATKNKS